MKLFTADTHFNHANIIKYCNRPFTTVTEMNKVMIDKWNSKVKPNDEVYHLGDFGFGNLENIIKSLNGRKTLIIGSHDRDTLKYASLFEEVTPLKEIYNQKQCMVLCHYAMRTWAKSHYNTWHLYGHSHGSLPPVGKSYDIGVDVTNFYPLTFYEVKDIMDKRPDNPNFLGNRRN